MICITIPHMFRKIKTDIRKCLCAHIHVYIHIHDTHLCIHTYVYAQEQAYIHTHTEVMMRGKIVRAVYSAWRGHTVKAQALRAAGECVHACMCMRACACVHVHACAYFGLDEHNSDPPSTGGFFIHTYMAVWTTCVIMHCDVHET